MLHTIYMICVEKLSQLQYDVYDVGNISNGFFKWSKPKTVEISHRRRQSWSVYNDLINLKTHYWKEIENNNPI